MVDEVTTSVPVVVTVDPAAVEAGNNAIEKTVELLGAYGNAAGASSHILDQLNSKFKEMGLIMDDNTNFTEEQAAKFGLLSVALIGTKRSFDNLSGSIDTKSMSTFKGQLEEMTSLLGTGGTAINVLSNLAINTFGTIIPKSIQSQGLPAIKAFVMNLAKCICTNGRKNW
jgi:hypothetical protein